MSTELSAILDSIQREKGISREVLIESIEAALVSAAKKVLHDKDKEVQVKMDLESGRIRIFSEDKEIVSSEFGRIAAQTAKQVIFQKIREAERDVIFQEFSGKIHSIVNGTVYRFEKGALLVDLGKTEAILPRKELSPRDNYRQGDTIRAYVLDVNRTGRGSQILLSRSHPGFVKRLFELEVPEVAEGTVQMKSVSREAGDRTKIAVWSENEKIDCVGACVGVRGSRVKGVVRELQGEKIDIIRWSENIEEFIQAALSPATVSSVKVLSREDKKVEVVVSDDQLSLAIGKNGQNVRLASKLTGWSIDIRSKKEIVKEKLEEMAAEAGAEEPSAGIESIEGVGPKTVLALAEAGYRSLEDLKKAKEEDLLAVKGIGKKTLEKILAALGKSAQASDASEGKKEEAAPEEGEAS
ncbi:MAG: transcription termination/antitermination protein NusA [Candidatus Omnitrophica bacterium]|nr:transcription termination/antitermination protein NusA [Candidatus Omnitrophota bacterium]